LDGKRSHAITTCLRIAACFLAFGLAAPAAAGLPEDMAAFERAYIPALALTNQPQAPAQKVEASLRRLEDGWPQFRQRLAAGGPPMDEALAEAGRAIEEARAKLAAGERAQAHDALERVRAALMRTRAQLGIELYVDRLTEYHDAMEDFVKQAVQGADAQALRPLLARAAELWTRCERPRFAPALFGMDDAKFEQIAALARRERELLVALEADLAAGQRDRVADGAKRLKGVFAQIYMSFGDFSGL
jgi:hypothetical protein